MRILEAVEINLEWSDMSKLTVHQQSPYEVVPGTVGVTTLLREIAIKKNMFSDDDKTDEFPLRMFDGMGWETVCAQLYKELWWQPGVFAFDGVAGHPDGMSTMTLKDGRDVYVVEEWKRTAKSLRVKGGKEDEAKDVRSEWMWMQQVMGYCNLLERHYQHAHMGFRHARLHVNWSCGNYTWPLTPRYMRYLVEFEEAELRGNWAMLQAQRRGELV